VEKGKYSDRRIFSSPFTSYGNVDAVGLICLYDAKGAEWGLIHRSCMALLLLVTTISPSHHGGVIAIAMDWHQQPVINYSPQ
jgi:hypothetical protein